MFIDDISVTRNMAHHLLVTNTLSLLYLFKLGVGYHYSKTMKNEMIMKLSIKEKLRDKRYRRSLRA